MSYSRKIYLINPRFQIKFSLLICFLVFLAGIIYPYTIYELLTALIEKNAGTNAALSKDYLSRRDQLVFFLMLLHIGFTSLTFLICIFFSHKIAGPIYKLQKHLKHLRDGDHPGKLFFRKGDYFPEVAEDINETFDQLEDSYKADLVYLSEVTSYINNLSLVVPDDKKIILNEITSRLNEMQERFTHK